VKHPSHQEVKHPNRQREIQRILTEIILPQEEQQELVPAAEAALQKMKITKQGVAAMTKQKVMVKNELGLHLRPAGLLCRTAMLYKSNITLGHKNATANAKSVLSVLGAGVKTGDELEITCEGIDEQEAMEALVKLFESGLE
jgi:phosphocarrier protein